ncbi:uncharacterized protein EKO05_0002597 [Ascochyta rabiei]|uniref:uncharacterized protein n=1 Tax=Didymella rabiei TaxID=5454 RepID=UPI001900D409|nr:uncharacterized protein EKO05_0002597 [Ascochyta rabiei]UPX12019.1 hypothetical protein EKO05_0002597 [Ascochyta rabiei]
MSFISPRTISHASISTLDHQWEPQHVLDLQGDGRCVGLAPSKGRKCHNPISTTNLNIFDNIITELSRRPLDITLLRPHLERLARCGLCLKNHQGQADDMVKKWSQAIEDAVRRLTSSARRTTTDTQSSTGTPSTTAIGRPDRTSGTRSGNPLPPISSPPSPSLSALQSEAETLERSILTMQETITTAMRRLQRLQSLLPAVDIAPLHARVPTAEISSLHLSRAPSTTSAAPVGTFDHRRNSTDPSRPSSQGRSMPTSLSSAPYASPPSDSDSGVAFDWDSDSDSDDAFRPLPPLMFGPIRRHISLGAPVLPALAQTATAATRSSPAPVLAPVPRYNTAHARRLSLSEECPICYSGGPLSAYAASELIWCTSSCGRTIHKSCFNDWRAQCSATNWKPDCPVCRADWDDSCACGGLSNCTSVHVHRQATSSPCPICKEDMEEGEMLQWCKDSCGQNVHKECADAWAAQCVGSGRQATCTMCRAPWVEECNC